ncbi:hypothetical protein TNCV_1124071 [Trichonephila clavipes]|uniref:Uncharacterized protein n=1 Tax=Trichonephila clavipes TaxID=2585209 RepID=A0A8X6SGA7_TRICX|nr:hypothetical protein TNCV_1124071 [Trichonephila clavipes]
MTIVLGYRHHKWLLRKNVSKQSDVSKRLQLPLAIPIATSNFEAQFPHQREAHELCREHPSQTDIQESLQAKRTPKGFFTCRIIIRYGRCRFFASRKSTDLERG